jgi:hypothetical protein
MLNHRELENFPVIDLISQRWAIREKTPQMSDGEFISWLRTRGKVNIREMHGINIIYLNPSSVLRQYFSLIRGT